MSFSENKYLHLYSSILLKMISVKNILLLSSLLLAVLLRGVFFVLKIRIIFKENETTRKNITKIRLIFYLLRVNLSLLFNIDC